MKIARQADLLIFRITLAIGIIVFSLILKSQLFGFMTSGFDAISYLIAVIILFFVVEHFIRTRLKSKYVLVLSSVIMIINIAVGVVIVNSFLTPLVVEPSYVFDYAKKWMNGPYPVLHPLVWTHWGFYGLLLSRIFEVFGSTIFVMKMIGVGSIVILDFFLIFLQKDLKEKSRPIFIALLLMSMYPLIMLFLNFPTGDLIYIGLWGPVLYLFNKLLDDKISIKKFVMLLMLASVVLSVQNLFKDTIIVILPILSVVVGFFLLKRKSVVRIILVPVVIFGVFTIIHAGAVWCLERYAVGISNTSKIGYFIATGTSQSSKGLFNGDYYYKKYWGPLQTEYINGSLNRGSYAVVDKEMSSIAKTNITSDPNKLFDLLVKKNDYMWSSDLPIIRQTSFDDPVYSGVKNTPMEPHRDIFVKISDSFLVFITALFVIDCIYILFLKKWDFINVFCAISVIGLFVAFSVMEGQPRYRIVLTPLFIISAGYGLEAASAWARTMFGRLKLKKSDSTES